MRLEVRIRAGAPLPGGARLPPWPCPHTAWEARPRQAWTIRRVRRGRTMDLMTLRSRSAASGPLPRGRAADPRRAWPVRAAQAPTRTWLMPTRTRLGRPNRADAWAGARGPTWTRKCGRRNPSAASATTSSGTTSRQTSRWRGPRVPPGTAQRTGRQLLIRRRGHAQDPRPPSRVVPGATPGGPETRRIRNRRPTPLTAPRFSLSKRPPSQARLHRSHRLQGRLSQSRLSQSRWPQVRGLQVRGAQVSGTSIPGPAASRCVRALRPARRAGGAISTLASAPTMIH